MYHSKHALPLAEVWCHSLHTPCAVTAWILLLDVKSQRTKPVYCRGQKLSIGVLLECKCSAVVAQLTTTMVPHVTDPSNCPFASRSGSPSNTWFLGPIWDCLQMASWSFQPFCWAHGSVPIIYNGPQFFPTKTAPSPWEIEAPSNTWLLGPTQVSTPQHLNQIRRFCRAHECSQPTNRQNDHTTVSVAIVCYHHLPLQCSLMTFYQTIRCYIVPCYSSTMHAFKYTAEWSLVPSEMFRNIQHFTNNLISDHSTWLHLISIKPKASPCVCLSVLCSLCMASFERIFMWHHYVQ